MISWNQSAPDGWALPGVMQLTYGMLSCWSNRLWDGRWYRDGGPQLWPYGNSLEQHARVDTKATRSKRCFCLPHKNTWCGTMIIGIVVRSSPFDLPMSRYRIVWGWFISSDYFRTSYKVYLVKHFIRLLSQSSAQKRWKAFRLFLSMHYKKPLGGALSDIYLEEEREGLQFK